MKPKFMPGKNIALKVPPHEFEQTVTFYGKTLGFEQVSHSSSSEYESVVFKFGDKNLWIDRTPSISHAEIWLEIITDSIKEAAAHFEDQGVARVDDIEVLPEELKGFWISSPSNIIHLVVNE